MWNKFHDKDMINQFRDRLIILGIYSFLLLFHLAKRNEYIYVGNLFIFVPDTSPFMFLKKRLIKKINKTNEKRNEMPNIESRITSVLWIHWLLEYK